MSLKSKIRFIGRGSAFNTKDRNSSFILQLTIASDTPLDVVFEVPMSTTKRLIDYYDATWHIRDTKNKFIICISHLHEDHVGGLTTFLFWLKYTKQIKLNEQVSILCPATDELKLYLKLTGLDQNDIPKITETRVGHEVKTDDGDRYLDIISETVNHIKDMECIGFSVYLDEKEGEHTSDSFFYTGDCNEIPDEILKAFKLEKICTLITEVSDISSLVKEPPVHITMKYLMDNLTLTEFERVLFTHTDSEKMLTDMTNLSNTIHRHILYDWAKGTGISEEYIQINGEIPDRNLHLISDMQCTKK